MLDELILIALYVNTLQIYFSKEILQMRRVGQNSEASRRQSKNSRGQEYVRESCIKQFERSHAEERQRQIEWKQRQKAARNQEGRVANRVYYEQRQDLRVGAGELNPNFNTQKSEYEVNNQASSALLGHHERQVRRFQPERQRVGSVGYENFERSESWELSSQKLSEVPSKISSEENNLMTGETLKIYKKCTKHIQKLLLGKKNADRSKHNQQIEKINTEEALIMLNQLVVSLSQQVAHLKGKNQQLQQHRNRSQAQLQQQKQEIVDLRNIIAQLQTLKQQSQRGNARLEAKFEQQKSLINELNQQKGDLCKKFVDLTQAKAKIENQLAKTLSDFNLKKEQLHLQNEKLKLEKSQEMESHLLTKQQLSVVGNEKRQCFEECNALRNQISSIEEQKNEANQNNLRLLHQIQELTADNRNLINERQQLKQNAEKARLALDGRMKGRP